MADYFTRLAERVMGTAPVVRPLISPLYAQAPLSSERSQSFQGRTEGMMTADHPVKEHAAQQDRFMEKNDRRPYPGSEMPVAMSSRLQEQTAERREGDPGREDLVRRARISSHRAFEESYDGPVGQGKRPFEHGTHQRTNGPGPTKISLEREPDDQAVHREAPENDRSLASRAAGKRAGQHVPDQESSQAVPAEHLPVPHETRIIPRMEAAAKNIRVILDGRRSPDGVPRPSVRGPLTSFRSPREDADPRNAIGVEHRLPSSTVKVTIGRIDVRAIMPSTGPPKTITKGRTGPMLTLDEYLKNRSGGR